MSGSDTVALEAPHMFAGAAEAGLHLVGNEQAARPLDRLDRALQEARRLGQDAVAGEQRIDDQHGRLDAVALQVGDRRLDVAREALGQVGALGVIQARRRHQAHMRAEIDGHAQRRRELRHGVGDAVIGGVGHDDAGAAGADLGDAIGEVVRLAARAGQHQVGQLGLRHAREQALGQLEDRVVQIARIGRQRLHLPADRLGHRAGGNARAR